MADFTAGDLLVMLRLKPQSIQNLGALAARAIRSRQHISTIELNQLIVEHIEALDDMDLISVRMGKTDGRIKLTQFGNTVKEMMLEEEKNYPLEPWDFTTTIEELSKGRR